MSPTTAELFILIPVAIFVHIGITVVSYHLMWEFGRWALNTSKNWEPHLMAFFWPIFWPVLISVAIIFNFGRLTNSIVKGTISGVKGSWDID